MPRAVIRHIGRTSCGRGAGFPVKTLLTRLVNNHSPLIPSRIHCTGHGVLKLDVSVLVGLAPAENYPGVYVILMCQRPG